LELANYMTIHRSWTFMSLFQDVNCSWIFILFWGKISKTSQIVTSTQTWQLRVSSALTTFGIHNIWGKQTGSPFLFQQHTYNHHHPESMVGHPTYTQYSNSAHSVELDHLPTTNVIFESQPCNHMFQNHNPLSGLSGCQPASAAWCEQVQTANKWCSIRRIRVMSVNYIWEDK